MTDGSTRIVGYNQAASIYQILLGNKKPENDKQEAFVLKVADVLFDKSTPTTNFQNRLAEFKRKHNLKK